MMESAATKNETLVLDIYGSSFVGWGESREDSEYVKAALVAIQDLARAAGDADTAEEGREILEGLRGQAPLLGVAVRPTADVVVVLKTFLTQSRDYEGALGVRIIREKGDHRLSSQHSGRRGLLDTAVYAIEEAERKIGEMA